MGTATRSKNTSTTTISTVLPFFGRTVDIFDVDGIARSFGTGDVRSNYSGQKLCFSSHGHVNVDSLLTHCFDEEGKHGEPEDDCFCGVDDPHLHAHVHDPARCSEDHQSDKNNEEADVMFLSKLTLLPTDDG